MADEPIDEKAYLGGPTVVDIGELRVGRGMTRRPVSSCLHKRLSYDPTERRVWCQDCEQDIDPFDAFYLLVGNVDQEYKRLDRRAKEIEEAEQRSLIRRAAKALDQAWRRKNMVPVCPVCQAGLLPEDFAGRQPCLIGRDWAEADRRRRMNRHSGEGEG